jgi:hypothetical protein
MLLDIQTHPNLPTWQNLEAIPTKAEEARAAIVEFEKTVLEAPDFQEVQRGMDALDVIKTLFKKVRDVRWQAEDSMMCGTWRIAREYVAAQEGGLVAQEGRPKTLSEGKGFPTIAQLFGGKGYKYAHQLRIIEPLGLAEIRQKCMEETTQRWAPLSQSSVPSLRCVLECVSHRAVVPLATTGGGDAAGVQRTGNRAEAAHAALLGLTNHRQHVAGEGISRRAVGFCAFHVRCDQAGAIAQW